MHRIVIEARPLGVHNRLQQPRAGLATREERAP